MNPAMHPNTTLSDAALESTPQSMPSAGPMLCLQGHGVVKGFVIGRAVVMGAAALEVPHYRIATDEVPAEIERLRRALEAARHELHTLIDGLPEDAPRDMAALLSVHGMLLEDPSLPEQVSALITDRHYNAEWALTTHGQWLGEQFDQMEDDYLRERGADIRQVIERVLRVMSGAPPLLSDLTAVPQDEHLIVVARDISPADMLKLRDGRFAGFLTDLGGPASHTAIVARSMNVPAVVALGNVRSLVRDGEVLIVDGASGAVVVNPSATVLREYRKRQADYAEARAALARLSNAPTITLDGVRVSLEANIELPEEVHAALAAGADAIGLFRSEFLFMGRDVLPDENEQYQAYARVVKTMDGRPVTIRTLDIGADKTLDGDATVATNPALGLRAIRYCLAHPELFLTQLRALLRAAAHGPVRVLIPMIAHVHEISATRRLLNVARAQLTTRGNVPFGDVTLGAMVEIPAIAIAIEPFVEQLDFLSIGTNDLIQYTLAVDRGDSDVADLYDPLHPAVLRLIANTIHAGERAGKHVAVCGEMAGDASLTRVLLGLGLKAFSMHPQQLLDVKKEILQSHSNMLRDKVAGALNRAQWIDLDVLL